MSANHKNDKKNKKVNEELNNVLTDNEELEDDIIVEMTDEEGNVYLYEEEMMIPIDDKKFAILVALPYETDENGELHYHEHGCDCGCEEDDVIIAKIVTNQDGEEEYIEPTDEEFEMVRKAYNDFFSDELEEEQAKE